MRFSETETVELKSEYTEDIKKEIIAFANTRGGKIYIGIEDNGNVCGISDSDFTIQQVSNAARDGIKPDITMSLRYNIITADKKQIIEIEVQCGTHRPYYLAAKGLRPEGVFVRQGTSAVPASDTAIRQMIKETDGDNYEDMRSLNQNLTFVKAKKEFELRGLKLGQPQMKSLGIIDGDGLYSNLALLLSDQCPHIIKAATFSGTDRESFHDRAEFGGSLLQQLEDAYAYMNLRNSNSASFDGLLRIDRKSYPDTALREALLNAVVHRDYSISAGTLLGIYSDRMEIVSVGGLAGGLSYDDIMLGVSCSRNEKLAGVFYRLRLIESYGTGIGRIMGSYRNHKAKPLIQVSSGAFKITLPDMNFSSPENSVCADNAPEYDVRIKTKEQVLLELFRRKKILTRAEIEEYLGFSASTAVRLLNSLLQKGLLKSKGNGKNKKYICSFNEQLAMRNE